MISFDNMGIPLDYFIYMIGITSYPNLYIGTGYFYSPLFALIFYPFLYLGNNGWMFLLSGLFLISNILVIQKLRWWSLGYFLIAIEVTWYLFINGNIDCIIVLIACLIINHKNPKIRGLVWGLLTFKPNFIVTFPFFLINTEKKQFIIYAILGIFLNYGYFLIDWELFRDFIYMLTHFPDYNWMGYIKWINVLEYGWFRFSLFFGIRYYVNKILKKRREQIKIQIYINSLKIPQII